jgi:hypothetical protein
MFFAPKNRELVTDLFCLQNRSTLVAQTNPCDGKDLIEVEIPSPAAIKHTAVKRYAVTLISFAGIHQQRDFSL